MRREIRYMLIITATSLIFSIYVNLSALDVFTRNMILIIPDIFGYGLVFDVWKKIVGDHYAYSEYLSQTGGGFYVLSLPYLIVFTLSPFLENHFVFQSYISSLVKICVQLLAFLGGYVLTSDYLHRSQRSSDRSLYISAFISGLLFGSNPSYFVGDWWWLTIVLGYATLPWVILCINKVVFDGKWKYSIVCALLIILNTDEHMLFAGYPLILLLYCTAIFLGRLLIEKKADKRCIISPFIVILLYLALMLHRIFIKYFRVTPYNLSYSFALTKEGVDVPWMQASILNMFRAMSHMDLQEIYATSHPLFSSLNSLMPLTLLIPTLAFMSFLFYKRNWVILFYGILFTFSILPFYIGSPFKWLHYWVLFNVPFGLAFRTWRISDAFVALSLSILTGFSLYYIFERLCAERRFFYVLLIVGTLFLNSIYSWPLLTGDVNGRSAPTKIPNEYLEVFSVLLSQAKDFKVIYIPEFVYSYGKNNPLKPFWHEWGALQEFLTFSSPKPTFWPVGSWGHFYDFTLSPFYYSLLKTGAVDILSYYLRWANIKYVVIHDDIPSIRETIIRCINFLNASNNFKLIYRTGFIYIFENQLSADKIEVLPYVILVDGGYRVVKKFLGVLNDSSIDYSFVFVDQAVPLEVIERAEFILTDKEIEQLAYDLIFNKLVSQDLIPVIYPYEYVIGHDPQSKWSRASYLDPHQQVWHPYVNWQDYAWDFDYMKGVVFTDNSNDSLIIPFAINKGGSYVIMLRLMGSDRGGEVSVVIDNRSFLIRTLDDYNGFLWYVFELPLDSGNHVIKITNVRGFNAISVISMVPEEKYSNALMDTTKLLTSKVILNLSVNLIKNPSFEGSTEKGNTLVSWEKKDPTKYVVKINITKPTMLSLAESYDPGWHAYVNGKKIQSIPLNGVINGFWINQTGFQEITIEYEPQKWTYYGLAVSLLTLTVCILYLAKEPFYVFVSKILKLKLTF
jgi:hypothetical protein